MKMGVKVNLSNFMNVIIWLNNFILNADTN
jgi:hypothetical protein